jgi:thiol-disulfide isomerase/thioredoxin
MDILKKNWKNALFLVFAALLLIPNTSMPIKVFFNRLVAFTPAEVKSEERELLSYYDWDLRTLDKKLINFSRSKAKVTVVNLWATWCPPCVAEMPSFQKLYDAYADQIDFYFITAEHYERPLLFLKKNEYDFPVYITAVPGPEPLRSRSIPMSYVISKTGEVVIAEKGAANWNSDKVHSILDRLLAE